MAGIDVGSLGIGIEKLGNGAERRVSDLLAFEVLWPADAGILQNVDGVRRLGVDDGNELGGNLIVAAPENDGGCVGKANLGGTGCHLLHGVGGALAAHDLDVEILPGVVALFESDEVIGMTAVVAEVGHEGHLVGGRGLIRAERACQERREHSARVCRRSYA